MKFTDILRKLAAYAVAPVAAVAAGAENPFPPTSRLHPFVAPVAALLSVLLALIVHPNGVNGPAKGADKKLPIALPILLLLGGSLLFAQPARADVATFDQSTFAPDQPGGLLPEAGACFNGGRVCLQPAATVVPVAIDVRSGKLSHNIGFGFGYGLVFAHLLSDRFRPGIDFLGGIETGGNWLAGGMLRLGALRAGPIVSHNNGVNYLSIGFGAGI